MNTTANPNIVSGPEHCYTCDSTHERCVCEWCHAGPPPAEPYCASCDRHHADGEEHCPNCWLPASSGFHAAPNIDECPIWITGRGWVPMEETTREERAATWPDGPHALGR